MNFEIIKEMGENGSDAVFIYHLSEHRFTYLNQMAADIWERPLDWFVQDPVQVTYSIHSDDLPQLDALYRQLQNGTGFGQVEAKVVMPSGGIKTIYFKVYALNSNPEGGFLAGFAEDITPQKMHETYLLEFGNKKNSILEILAHDLAGPLHIAKNLATSLEQENHHQNPTAEYARIIQQVCNQSINLIGDLLIEEHQKSPMISAKMEVVDVVELLKLVVKPYQVANASLHQIDVISNADKILLELDKIKFSQVVNNLISNAIKFTPANGSILFSLTESGQDVLLTVTDSGIGIPEELQPFMFLNYTKAARPGLKGEKPKGVGMYISKTLVEMQNGKIWFESKENVGTTFFVLFPKNKQ